MRCCLIFLKTAALYIHALKIKSMNKARIDDYLQWFAKFYTIMLLDKNSPAAAAAGNEPADGIVRFQDFYYVLTTAADLLRDMNLSYVGKSDLIKSKVPNRPSRQNIHLFQPTNGIGVFALSEKIDVTLLPNPVGPWQC